MPLCACVALLMVAVCWLQTFIKTVNYTHLMPTRYTMDVDFSKNVTAEVTENSTKKVEARKVCLECHSCTSGTVPTAGPAA